MTEIDKKWEKGKATEIKNTHTHKTIDKYNNACLEPIIYTPCLTDPTGVYRVHLTQGILKKINVTRLKVSKVSDTPIQSGKPLEFFPTHPLHQAFGVLRDYS